MTEHIINQTLQKNFHGKDDWNHCLNQFKDKNIFQSYEWGELKKSEGWEVLHIIVTDNETLKCILLAQVLTKKVMGIKIAWCPGGPIVQCDNSNNGIDALEKFQEVIFEEKIFNLRCKPYMLDISKNQKIFSNISKSTYSFTSSKSILLKIVSDDEFLQQVKKKHRYSIKQSEKSGLTWKRCSSSDTAKVFSSVHDEMQENKNLKLPIIDIAVFEKILNANKDNVSRLFTFAGFENNNPVSVCLISILGNKAFYHYAASTERGRELSASYGMIYNLVRELKNLSIAELDFGGVSTDESSSGVDFFKHGFNGQVFNKIGEFDIAKSTLYSSFFSNVLRLKNK